MALTTGPIATLSASATTTTTTFPYDGIFGSIGVPQVWIVPKHVFEVTFHAYGAQGGDAQFRGTDP